MSTQHINQHLRLKAMLSVSALVLSAMPVASALAQTDANAEVPRDDASEQIVVTGSRIVRNGYQAPTPLTVLSESEIRSQSTTNNIADYVNQIPSVAGSTRPGNSRLAISSGLAGVNALNLRNLGTERTLVLLDGHRSVGSSITGAVDVNDFPQALVKSVEIVTGGASAAYGSDAVSGVVNFILDKEFTGVKGTVENGLNEEGDGHNYLVSLAAGTKFGGGRGHIMISGEYAHRDGIFEVTRDWNQNGDRTITNPAYTATNGLPQYLVVTNSGTSNLLPGSIINSSAGTVPNALRGIYFGQGGSVNRYTYGTINNSTNTVGGDWALADGNRRIGLDPSDDRRGIFGRVSYEFADWLNLFGEASYNRHHSVFNAGPSLTSAATISASNPYLIAALGPQQLAGVTSVSIGTSAADFPYRKNDNKRSVQRYVLGGDGSFEALGTTFRWDGYGQYGQTRTYEMARDIINTARLALATDAVRAPAGNALGVAAGTIVCRSTLTNTSNGCVPLNRLGIGVADPAAVDYVLGDPYRKQKFTQKVVAFNLAFDPFSTWAGPVSIATGAEYRREQVSGFVEEQYQSGWAVGNFRPTFGHYSVKEAYLEAAVPLGAGIDLNGAVRATDYSSSGYVTTWKGGVTFQPVPDIRLRLTRSRDIRAPNLNELFQSGTSRTNTLNDPFNNNAVVQFLEVTTGNRNLRPEIANTLSFGTVVQPRFIPGLSASVDFYDIKISGAIGQVRAQEIINRCYQGLTEYCAAFTRQPGSTPELTVQVSPFNFSKVHARGLDFDISYKLPLQDISEKLPGTLSLRGMATHYLKNYVNNGIDAPVDSAGANGSGGTPSWLYRISAAYAVNGFTLTAVARGISAGTLSNSYVVCSTACPASTTANPTINANHVPGAVYADLNLAQQIKVGGGSTELYAAISNLFDRDPVILPEGGLSTNPTYYDYLGRTYRIGLRFQF